MRRIKRLARGQSLRRDSSQVRRQWASSVSASRLRPRVCDLLVDPATRRVLLAEGCSEVTMTAAEFDLLACFVERPQRVLSREQLLDWTRGRSADVFDRTIDVQVSRLRKRLDDAGSTASGLLKTVRNAGYILSAPVRTA